MFVCMSGDFTVAVIAGEHILMSECVGAQSIIITIWELPLGVVPSN